MQGTSPDQEEAHAFYQEALRRVLWGERKEEVLEALRERGIGDGDAEAIYQRALAERTAAIRHECANKMKGGAALIIVGIAVVVWVWFVTDGFENWCPRGHERGIFRNKGCGEASALVVGAIVSLGGIIYSIYGFACWLMADKETGPVADKV